MLFSKISSSDVRPGDHLYRYRYRWFEKQQGIAVRFPKLSSIFVITSYKDTLRLVTLTEFKGRSCLRRAVYNQPNRSSQMMKSRRMSFATNSRPSEEIVQNAFLLLDWIKTSPDHVRTLLANDLSQFARRCCTTIHEQWRNRFHPNGEQASPKKDFFNQEQVSDNSNAFNAALMCGMPFRQASLIGKEKFWSDKFDENCSSQTRKDTEGQLSSSPENTSDELMVFSSTLIELSSDDELLSYSVL